MKESGSSNIDLRSVRLTHGDVEHQLFDVEQVGVELSRGFGTSSEAFLEEGTLCVDGLSTRADVARFVRQVMRVSIGRDEDSDGLTAIEQRNETATWGSLEAFSQRHLYPHTDGSGLDNPPTVVLLVPVEHARTGGQTLLVDGLRLWSQLSWTAPHLLETLCDERVAAMGDPLRTTSIFETCDSSIPRIKVRFRNDSDIFWRAGTGHAKEALLLSIREATSTIELPAGRGLLIQNNRWLHGRLPFGGGKRSLLRGRGKFRNEVLNKQIESGFVVP